MCTKRQKLQIRQSASYLVLRKDLGAERGFGDAQEVVTERDGILSVVHGKSLEVVSADGDSFAVSRDDGHGVYALRDQPLRLAQEFPRQHDDGRRSVAHLVVLRLGYVDEHACGRVVDVD